MSNPELHGVIPRSALSIFEELSKPEYIWHKVVCSYLEIYNEELGDLLLDVEERKRNKLEIMEGREGTVCRGLTEKEVKNAEDVLTLMQTAQKQKKISETKMNKHSSRSHCIFTIRVNAKKQFLDLNKTLEVRGKLHLVDLAGSECAKSAGLSSNGSPERSRNEASRERERMNINRSLLTLGRVILLLKEQSTSTSKKSSNVRIPYRDSKLTRILQKSLGGGCKTLIIATLSPSVSAIEESISTLNYAQTANGIINKPVAVSYLSMNSGIKGSNGSVSTSTTGDMTNSEHHTVEHWYEMECRLAYMQTQVEEAQSALARTFTQQQEYVQRAETAEKKLTKMEELYTEAKEDNAKMKENIAVLRKEKDALSLLLEDTKLQLRKTYAVLEATQDTEVQLTSEATSLIMHLKDSIYDGDQIHDLLLQSREAEIQKREATRNFHSVAVQSLETVLFSLDELMTKEKKFNELLLENSRKEQNMDHKSLETSIELVKTISEDVSNITDKIKAFVQDEDGVLAILSKVTSDASETAKDMKSSFMDGEADLLASVKSTRVQLDGHFNDLKNMDAEYVRTSEQALQSLKLNISDSSDKVTQLVSTATTALSRVRKSGLETRTAISSLISTFHEDYKKTLSRMEDATSSQHQCMSTEIESFQGKMKHNVEAKRELENQQSYMNINGSQHMRDMQEQEKMLTYQKENFEEIQKEQLEMQNTFTKNVFEAMQTLLQNEMEEFSKKREQHLKSLESSTDGILEMNNNLDTSASTIFKEVNASNVSLLNHVEESHEKDISMKNMALDTTVVLDECLALSQKQQKSGDVFAKTLSGNVNDLSTQDAEIGEVNSKMLDDENDTKQQLTVELHGQTQSSINELKDMAKGSTNFATDTVITNAKDHLSQIEKPRQSVSLNFMSSMDKSLAIIDEGEETIRNVLQQQCTTSDEMRQSVEEKRIDYETIRAEERRNEIEENKMYIDKNVDLQTKVSTKILKESMSSTGSTKENLDGFATDIIQYNEEVPPVSERKAFPYSSKLSATPTKKEIYRVSNLI